MSRFARVRVSCLREKRDSFVGFLNANGDGARWDSGLYIGEVYVDEPGLTAAGVGGKGRSSMDEPKESSARRTMPACAALRSPYRGRFGAICLFVSTRSSDSDHGHKPLEGSTANLSPTEVGTAHSNRDLLEE